MARTDVRVSAIIIRGDNLLTIHRKKNGEEYWVFPGGGVEDTETVEEALVREVKEETGLDVINYKLAFSCFSEMNKREIPFYFCTVSKGEPQIIGEENERNSAENWYQLEWINIDKVKDINLVPKTAKEEFIKITSTLLKKIE